MSLSILSHDNPFIAPFCRQLLQARDTYIAQLEADALVVKALSLVNVSRAVKAEARLAEGTALLREAEKLASILAEDNSLDERIRVFLASLSERQTMGIAESEREEDLP